jgi:hypothetical protein
VVVIAHEARAANQRTNRRRRRLPRSWFLGLESRSARPRLLTLAFGGGGRYEFRTIRPAGYPATDLPAHIHVQVDSAGGRARSYVTEIRFDDDPRLTPAWRERSRQEGCLIGQVKRGADNIQGVIADLPFR